MYTLYMQACELTWEMRVFLWHTCTLSCHTPVQADSSTYIHVYNTYREACRTLCTHIRLFMLGSCHKQNNWMLKELRLLVKVDFSQDQRSFNTVGHVWFFSVHVSTSKNCLFYFWRRKWGFCKREILIYSCELVVLWNLRQAYGCIELV